MITGTCPITQKDAYLDDHMWTKFVWVREVTVTDTGNVNFYHLQCSCACYSRHGLPCTHAILLCENIQPSMHKVRWWKTYHDSYLNDHDVTEEINSYLTTEETMPNVITVSKANLKVNNDIVTTAVQDAIRAIRNNETPIICDGPYKTHLTNQISASEITEAEDESSYNLDIIADDSGATGNYYGVHSEVALGQEQQEIEFRCTTEKKSTDDRYHRCMAAINEVLKVCIESEETTEIFLNKMQDMHREMVQHLSTPVVGTTVTCCLPIESRKSAKWNKTLGYI